MRKEERGEKKEEEGRTKEELIAFLRSKRWFGDKAREIRDARVRDSIPVQWPDNERRFAVSRVEVATDEGGSTYQLFSPRTEHGEALINMDALEDASFRRGLADGWAQGCTFENAGVKWIIQSESKVPLVVPVDGTVTLAPGEQTNSSIVLNREGILKLYRRIEPGTHPDIEVTRFLTIERQFTHVPVLLGTIRFEDRHGVMTAGMLQEYVQGAIDAWQFTLQQLKDDTPFANDAEELGVVVRSLHKAMASGDTGSAFEYQRATAGDVLDWIAGARRTITRALDALARSLERGALKSDAAREAQAVADRGPIVLRRVESVGVRLKSDAGAATRIHGDLHLGQILRSAAKQFLVIDFEGEPTRPLEERRRRSSPLRDVAGMLRSLSYAALSAKPASPRWEEEARAAFLRGYLAPTQDDNGQPLVPDSPDNTDALVTLFETEKAFYELQYELDHRPDWAWIPLRGITRLI
jgi:trehalose synthase-fused probable maltokinase